MKRRKTILCTILVLLAVSLAGLFWWQRDNLKAIHAATQHTSAELEEKLEVLRAALETENADKLRAALHRVVPTFREPEEVNAAQGETVEIPDQGEAKPAEV